ncbi:MAG: GDSL-type esterase/lipase family protein [Lachnospiraceae bacterium]|nr:GDSL-type esterase/lipase family protein [Lachnospiraceae bacterium]MDD3616345.1 GDSL-type esterase/lipase family protein [Lachnospiraceae bacterium]
MAKWVSMWGQSHTDIRHRGPDYKGRTMRLIILNNIDGEKIRIRISNLEGKKPYKIVEAGIRKNYGESKMFPITFSGKKDCEVQPGEEFYSDEIPLQVVTQDQLEISMAFSTAVYSGNGIDEHVQCSKNGNYVQEAQFQTVHRNKTSCFHDLHHAIPAISSMEAYAKDEAGAIICFGDSITQQSTWTRVLRDAYMTSEPGITSIVNKGIDGNRLLYGPLMKMMKMYGRAGIERFQRDVLEEAGAKAVIIAIGTNDIGMSRNEKSDTYVTAEQLAVAQTKLAEKARENGMMVYGSTLLPRVGTTGYLEMNERERLKFNEWIRNTDVFHHVFDFEKVVRNPEHPEMLEFACDRGDHLHPSELGGKRIAQLILQEIDG